MSNTTTLKNKLHWATCAIRQAIETMTPPAGRRDYNKHTVACRENLIGTLSLLETSDSEIDNYIDEIVSPELATRAMNLKKNLQKGASVHIS